VVQVARKWPDFFSSITDNGLFVALAALTLEIPLFLPLAVAAISGDSVAGEANLGTLRYVLTVPSHRTRLLGVKYLAVVIFALAATHVIIDVVALNSSPVAVSANLPFAQSSQARIQKRQQALASASAMRAAAR